MAAEQGLEDATKPRTSAANGRLWGLRSEDWAAIQEGQCEPAYAAVLDKASVGSGTRVLDAGCGAGMAARLAADRGAAVAGVDASPSLLDIARMRVPDGRFHLGDLEDLPFETGSFDVVTGFNSFQYAGDPVAALREASRVSTPAGLVFVMTWGEPEGMEAAALVAALKPLLPPPPPGAPGPFALSDETRLRALASEAGLTPVEVFDVDNPWIYPDLDTALRGLRSSGVAARAIETSGESALDAAHVAALARFERGDGSYRIGASFRVLMAAAGT